MEKVNEPTLHQVLAAFGIVAKKDERCIADLNRSLYQNGEFIGTYTASEGWDLVNDLRFGVDEPEAA